MLVENPILPGCYPDPSICRVGDDYYLVCSTFEYLPGLPVFHSRDLAHWEQIGHVIDRPGMLAFDGIGSSGGLFAPTIRHNPANNKYYIVCTLVDRGVNEKAGKPAGNFIVTADDPAGPWSNPIWINKPGIDPSLFFDDSTGKIWLHGTRLADPGEWFHQTEVWLQELDPNTLQPVGEEYILWTGAVRGAVWCEGPHIYHIGDYYYLLTAEGGTEFHHAISIARSKNITGPYEGNKCNPIFTHRNLGRTWPIMGVGHADLFPFGAASFENPLGLDAAPTDAAASNAESGDSSESDSPYTNPVAKVTKSASNPNGGWFAVLLGMRLYGGYHYNLGRETFLVPVIWEDDWPVFAPGIGHIPDTVEVPEIAAASLDSAICGLKSLPQNDDGGTAHRVAAQNDDGGTAHKGAAQNDDGGTTQRDEAWRANHTFYTITGEPVLEPDLVPADDLRWSALRALPSQVADASGNGWDNIPISPITLSQPDTPSFLGIRQTDQNCRIEVSIEAQQAKPGDWFGVAIRQSETDYATFMVSPAPGNYPGGPDYMQIYQVKLELVEKGEKRIIKEYNFDAEFTVSFDFVLQVNGQDYQCILGTEQGYSDVIGSFNGRTLDTAAAGGFLGLWIGIYATTENPNGDTFIDSATLQYRPN